MQQFTEAVASAGSDAVDGAHAAPSHALVGDGGQETAVGKLAHGIVEGADIDIGKALDHGLGETALNLIRMKIASVQDA
jgi:hypothetical protein